MAVQATTTYLDDMVVGDNVACNQHAAGWTAVLQLQWCAEDRPAFTPFAGQSPVLSCVSFQNGLAQHVNACAAGVTTDLNISGQNELPVVASCFAALPD
jgi:hypothetical protein